MYWSIGPLYAVLSGTSMALSQERPSQAWVAVLSPGSMVTTWSPSPTPARW